jgi:hypothetical protein
MATGTGEETRPATPAAAATRRPRPGATPSGRARPAKSTAAAARRPRPAGAQAAATSSGGARPATKAGAARPAGQRPNQGRPAPAPAPGPGPVSRLGAAQLAGTGVTADDGAGFLLGVFAWVLTLAYLRGGPGGVRDWLRAKFLNKGPDGERLP